VTSFLPGFLTMASLIVAIGAQNAYVLRTGLARHHVGLVVAVCALSDAVLVVAGVLGVGGLVTAHPGLLTVVRWVGAAYLVGYGVLCLRNARHPKGLEVGGTQRSRSGVLATVLALTWLNPHVYLDTVLLLGTIANHEGPTGRWWFAAGAAGASILWFCGLGFGARFASPALARPRAWQVLDVLIGVVMLLIALKLATG
jgi:L-lysine exporter family protein LysE/ArgO